MQYYISLFPTEQKSLVRSTPVSIICADLEEAKMKFEIITSEKFVGNVTAQIQDASGFTIESKDL